MWKKRSISITSGLHAVFLLLIRIKRYEHFPVFHNQKSQVISQKLSPSNFKHKRKQKEYLSTTNWFGYICCICHTHNFFNISQNILYCNLDANLQGRRQWRKETKKVFTSLSVELRQNGAVFIKLITPSLLNLKEKR